MSTLFIVCICCLLVLRSDANSREDCFRAVYMLTVIKVIDRYGGHERFRKVRGACWKQDLKNMSESEFVVPSYVQHTENVREYQTHNC